MQQLTATLLCLALLFTGSAGALVHQAPDHDMSVASAPMADGCGEHRGQEPVLADPVPDTTQDCCEAQACGGSCSFHLPVGGVSQPPMAGHMTLDFKHPVRDVSQLSRSDAPPNPPPKP